MKYNPIYGDYHHSHSHLIRRLYETLYFLPIHTIEVSSNEVVFQIDDAVVARLAFGTTAEEP
jgi:hypothetical protein